MTGHFCDNREFWTDKRENLTDHPCWPDIISTPVKPNRVQIKLMVKSCFTMVVIQNFVWNTKKEIWIPFRAYFRIQRKCQICSKRASYLGSKVDLISQNWYLVSTGYPVVCSLYGILDLLLFLISSQRFLRNSGNSRRRNLDTK